MPVSAMFGLTSSSLGWLHPYQPFLLATWDKKNINNKKKIATWSVTSVSTRTRKL